MKKLLSYLMTLVLALSIGFSGTAIYADVNDYVVIEGGGNASLSLPYQPLAKFEWPESGGSYTLEGSNSGITITSGSAISVSFTSTEPVFAVIVKGGNGFVIEPFEGVMSGSFTNENLSNNNAPDISNIKFYTLPEPPVTEPPVTEPPVTEPPVTEPPVTEPPVTNPPVTEPPVTEPPVPETTIEPIFFIPFSVPTVTEETTPEVEEEPEEVIEVIEPDPIPEAAPIIEVVVEDEPEEEAFEILDGDLPQDVPEMPQTSGIPALVYLLSGSALSSAGLIFKKRF